MHELIVLLITYLIFARFSLRTRPQVEDSKGLGLGHASRLAPFTHFSSNLSLAEISTEAGVASGPKESPATAWVICTNGREGEKKREMTLNFFPKSVSWIVG